MKSILASLLFCLCSICWSVGPEDLIPQTEVTTDTLKMITVCEAFASKPAAFLSAQDVILDQAVTSGAITNTQRNGYLRQFNARLDQFEVDGLNNRKDQMESIYTEATERVKEVLVLVARRVISHEKQSIQKNADKMIAKLNEAITILDWSE